MIGRPDACFCTLVLEMLTGGMTPEQALQDFPYLEKAEIDASLDMRRVRGGGPSRDSVEQVKFLVDANLPPSAAPVCSAIALDKLEVFA